MRNPQRRIIAVLITLATFAAPVASERAAHAAPGDTGRITLAPPVRVIDTRIPPPGSGPWAAGADVVLPSGLLMVTLVSAGLGGSADVFPCGSQPSGDATFRFGPGAFAGRQVVVPPNQPMCLRPTVAVNAMVDTFGSIATAPFAGGLQYHPLASPQPTISIDFADGMNGASRPVGTDPFVPHGASGAVYSIDLTIDEGFGYAAIHPCGQTVMAANIASSGGRNDSVAVAYVQLVSGQQPCLTTTGTGSIDVDLLGTFDTTGPDPTRLPPGTTSRLDDLPPPGFVPIAPERAFDTRTDGTGALQPDDVLEVDLTDYLTPFSTAVTMNVTATGAQDPGFLTVWPCDEDQPNASNLNFERGVDVPNLVTVRLSGAGTVCINGSAATHVIGDVAGTYEFGDGVGSTPMTPTRILDTRRSLGGTIVPANGTLTLQVSGGNGIPPSGVQAVTMNVTATGSQGDGYMTVWPCDQPRPNASNLNFRRGIDVPNLVTVKLSASGTVCFSSTATTHVIADAAMWFSDASTGGFIDVTPARVLDTRVPIGQPSKAKLAAGRPISVAVAGQAGVPQTGAASVTMNVTVANPETSGYLTVWPCGEPQPDASNLNFQAGVNVPNLVSVKLPANGSLCFFSTASTDVLADVAGFTTNQPLAIWTVVIV